jgi:hypothetical protein
MVLGGYWISPHQPLRYELQESTLSFFVSAFVRLFWNWAVLCCIERDDVLIVFCCVQAKAKAMILSVVSVLATVTPRQDFIAEFSSYAKITPAVAISRVQFPNAFDGGVLLVYALRSLQDDRSKDMDNIKGTDLMVRVNVCLPVCVVQFIPFVVSIV